MTQSESLSSNKYTNGSSLRTPTLSPEIKYGLVIGTLFLWAILVVMAFSEAKFERTKEKEILKSNAMYETQSKSDELSALFRELYIVTRTISMLPAVRHVIPQNRSSTIDDVIDGVRFNNADAETVQQLYNHAASIAEVSEIYITYDGFNSERGDVPFLMFDNVIVDRIHSLHALDKKLGNVSDVSDIPKEDESAEYTYLTQLIKRMNVDHPTLPSTAPKGIALDISPLMVTCDNTQYLSITKGNPIDRQGIILSVPIYDDANDKFKGVVSTIVRSNVLEARLLGWPEIPVTDTEQRQALLGGINLNNPPVNYVLENNATGMFIYDRRNTFMPEYIDGSIKPPIELTYKVDIGYGNNWAIHRFIPQAEIDQGLAPVQGELNQHLLITTMLIIVLGGGLWFIFYRRVAKNLEHIARHDSLTGLPNRRELNTEIMIALHIAKEKQQPLALVMVDLDHFKEINDSIGHAAGDQLLIEVSRRFEDILRKGDLITPLTQQGREGDPIPIVGRLGGDEFLILLPNIGSQEQALKVGERLIAGLINPILLDGHPTYCQASLGIALYPTHGTDAEDLLRRADSAMYKAKRVRGSSIAISDEELSGTSSRQLRLLSDLHVAIVKEEFILHFQPIFDVTGKRIRSVEALLRWQHPELGLIAPIEFIPLLEQTGLIVEVGEWILRKACYQLKCWKQSGSPIENISINVSVVQLSQSDFSSIVLKMVQDADIDPWSITIEITETVLMENPQKHINQLQKLRESGMEVALDDFGTGYSSLDYLEQLPVSILKIDRSLVVKHNRKTGQAILFSLCDMTRRMGIQCIAEGVENLDEYGTMIDAGCNAVQGWAIAKPMLAEDVDKFVRDFDIEAQFVGKELSTATKHTKKSLPHSKRHIA
jgi:diguanylate cyclase (GGDEF)-like protein